MESAHVLSALSNYFVSIQAFPNLIIAPKPCRRAAADERKRDNAPINGLPQDGGGGEGNPREFGILKFSQGKDFDIKNGLLG